MLPQKLLWKFIIYSCLGVIFALCLVWLFIPADPDTPTLPDELFLRSQAIEENEDTLRTWQYNLDHASRMFPDKSQDELIRAAGAKALADGDFGAACVNAMKAPGESLRDSLYAEIFKAACADCANLSWAVYCANNTGDQAQAASMIKEVEKRWRECEGAK